MKQLPFILLFLSSCSFFIEKLQKKENEEIKLKTQKQTFCKEQGKNELVLISTNAKIQEAFKEFMTKLSERQIYLNSVEKSIIWSLLQINSRPDLASATSRYQVQFKLNGQEHFYDFKSSEKDQSLPFLYGLNYILKKYSNGSRTLLSLARLIDLYYPNSFFIEQDFSKFLQRNRSIILKSPVLSSFYTRGQELLKTGERIPKLRFTDLVRHYLDNKKNYHIIKTDKLFEFKNTQTTQISCNIDMNLYSKSIFLINKHEVKTHQYGLKEKNFVYLASNAQEIQSLSPFKTTLLIQGSSHVPMPSLCRFSYKKETNSFSMWLSSSLSRDPGQHLYHLYQYDPKQVESVEDLDTLLRFSRHLFLSDPLRLIFESQRGNQEQLNDLLTLNIPIYNAVSLGRIWSYIDFPQGQDHFLIDDRRPGEISCLK